VLGLALSTYVYFQLPTRPPEKKDKPFLKIPGKKRQQKGKPTDKSLAPTDKYLAQRTSEYPNGQVLFLPVKTFT
jgi:hypothetical protein